MSKIPAVRILPMDSKTEPFFVGLSAEMVQQQFFLGTLLGQGRPPGKYEYRAVGLRALPGTVVLFQYTGKIVASATLHHVERFAEPEGSHTGAYHFEVASIKVFDPVGPEVISRIWPNFTGFGQAKWNLDPKGYLAFEQSLTGVETPKWMTSLMLSR
jgi:hypothetical protein